MKKMIALFMAFAFALTLGVAFAGDKTATPAAGAEKAPVAEKAPAKHKKHNIKKQKKNTKKEAAAPATK
jgi:hypothetical protein